jgi:proteic killer suppression protein
MAILSFTNKSDSDFFYNGHISAKSGWRNVASIVKRKLDMLDYAHIVEDLRSPPGNKLEELKGKRKGQFSIRVNDQWRIVFRWTANGPSDVAIIDYH